MSHEFQITAAGLGFEVDFGVDFNVDSERSRSRDRGGRKERRETAARRPKPARQPGLRLELVPISTESKSRSK